NFQAAYAIAATYFTAVLAGVNQYYFTRYATARTTEELAAEVHASASFVLRYTPILAFFAITFRDVVIHVLYSSRFSLAIDMLGLMLAADILRAVSWSYGGPLPMRGRVRAFLLSETTAVIIGLAAYWVV